MSTPPQQGLKTSSYVVICGILSVLGLGLFGFSNSVYAEVTTLTVSNSGETISFDKIKPSGSGTVTKATDSLSVNTNCTEGVDVYLSAINGGSTSLINNTVSNNGGNGGNNNNGEITTLSGTTIGDSSTAKALSSNTWGFNTVDDNTYYGLPTYANALSHAVYSGTDSSIPIYYGAKVTSSMATGKYNGSVLYTVLVNMNCNNYTVEYDINTPEGAEGSIVSSTPPDDTILTYAKKSKLAENTFEITGYNFLGWSLDPTATTPEYDANTTEYYGSDIALAASANPGSTITMYAIWEEATIYMQNWLGCASMPIGSTIKLTDKRDNTKYTVKKFGSGSDTECWMTQNLTLGYDQSTNTPIGHTLTGADTNIPDGNTYYLPPAGRYGSATDPNTVNSNYMVSFDESYENYAKIQYAPPQTDSVNPQPTGYYNFSAASLGYSYYLGGGSGDTPRDICPAGWQLPRGNRSSTYSFYWLDKALGGTGSDRTDTTTRDKYLNQASFNYPGTYYNSALGNVGSEGHWWSSTVYSGYFAYNLVLNSSGSINPDTTNTKFVGYSIRCVDKYSDSIGYMQDFDTNTELPNETDSTYLIDKRDGKKYAVKRLPDGKVWMMQNLTINGAELTPDDTNITDGNTYYLPKDGGAGSITNSATKDATTGYNFATNYSNQAMFKFRSKNTSVTNDSDTGYYNFYTATLGYSYYGGGATSGTSPRDICPKGWRMPRTTDSGTNVTAIDSTNDFAYLARTYSTSDWKNDATGNNGFSYYSTNSTLRTSIIQGAASPLATAAANNYAGFSYAGYWNSTNANATEVGSSNGGYWSASIYDTSYSYRLYLNSSDVYPQATYSNKFHGLPVRCIAKSSYTINYDANGGTGEMAPSKGYIGGSTLAKNTYIKDGYYFAGWSTDPSAATPTYGDNAYISTDLTSVGNSITLYAIWYTENQLTMQNSPCTNLPENSTTNLIDSRDNQKYSVYHFSTTGTANINYPTDMAGYCLMTQDLALGMVDGPNASGADSSKSQIRKNGDLILSANDSASSTSSSYPIYARTGTSDWNTNSSALQYFNGSQYNPNTNHSYYTFYAAQRVCPKGWRLPTVTEYSSISSLINEGFSNSFICGGYFSKSNGLYNANSFGEYWSSTQYNNDDGFGWYLQVDYTGGTSIHNNGKSLGLSVRCIAEP